MSDHIKQAYPEGVNIDKVGKYGKFVEFVRYKPNDPTCEDKLEIKNNWHHFTSDSFDQDELTPKMRLEAFARIIEYLNKSIQKQIEAEIESEMREIRRKIEIKVKDKYHLIELEDKYYKYKAYYESIKSKLKPILGEESQSSF